MASNLDLKLPANGHPTEVLAARFASWRKIIRALNVYFKEYASVQDEVVRHNVRLGHAVNFPFFQFGTADSSAAAAAAVAASAVAQTNESLLDAAASITSDQAQQGNSPFHLLAPNMHPEDDQTRKMFLPYGLTSIADVPGNVIAFHRAQAATASRTSKELTNNVIPRLEDLRRDLLVKIKEIKNLSSDFKNAVAKEQAGTHKELASYINAIEILNANPSLLIPKHDPFLLKYTLSKQITRQVNEENYLLEAFLNIQTSGKELERVVAQEVQQALNVFGRLTGMAAQNIQELLSNKILNGFVAKDPVFEWDNFVSRDPNFVDPNTKLRNANELVFPNMHSSLAHDIRSGYLERRSKYLKSYSRAYYVLTPSFLHEFKSPDRRKDPLPVMSLSLNDCQLSLDKKGRRSDSHKFILNAHQSGSSGISGKGHNWVFRAESKEKLDEWYQDLSILSQISTPVERANRYFPSQTPFEKQEPVSEPQQPAVKVNGNQDLEEDIDPLTPSRNISLIGTTAQRHRRDLLASPVLSDTSEATSTGEPFGALNDQDYSLASPNPDYAEEERRPGPRGRFPSEVNLNKYMADTSSNISKDPTAPKATPFVIPPEHKKLSPDSVDDDSSLFSYDLKKETHSTLPNDKDFKPINSDTPVNIERKLTQTQHKEQTTYEAGPGVARAPNDPIPNDHQEAITRRRSSMMSNRSGPQRQATGSFGMADDLKPLSSTNDQQPQGLFFAGGLPDTTSSGPA